MNFITTSSIGTRAAGCFILIPTYTHQDKMNRPAITEAGPHTLTSTTDKPGVDIAAMIMTVKPTTSKANPTITAKANKLIRAHDAGDPVLKGATLSPPQTGPRP
ncbi:MAG: hypothetical protein RR353_04485 [Victivallaceae bacterium]